MAMHDCALAHEQLPAPAFCSSNSASPGTLSFDALHGAYKEHVAAAESRKQQLEELQAAVASPGGQATLLQAALLKTVAQPGEDALMEQANKSEHVPRSFDPHTAQHSDEYVPVADPLAHGALLVDLDACTQFMSLSLHGPVDAASDAKAELQVPDAAMLVSPVARKYVRELAGPRYQWQHRRLRIVSRKFPTASQNQRHALEQAQAVLQEAEALAEEFGDFHQPKVVPLPYGHKARRRAKRRKAKAGLAF